MVRVKICGITNIEDALAAIEAGANALGFVFAESPRKIDSDTALSIIKSLPVHIAAVGVFADQEPSDILQIMEKADLHFAQIHGGVDESFAGALEGVQWGLIRALRIGSIEDIEQAAEDSLIAVCDAILLDSRVEGIVGGTGQTFNWELVIQARALGKPVILAGGLTPENVEEAVRQTRPYAVDVSTGVEASPGKKDHAKIKEFIQNARKTE